MVSRLPGPAKVRFPKRREDGIHRIEVHVAGICVRERVGVTELLVAQRTADRRLYPGKWECGGGMVRPGENFETALRRQIMEEFGLHVTSTEVLETYDIFVDDPQQTVIPGLRFLCRVAEEEVRLNPREFSDCAWVALLEIPQDDRDFIGSLGETLRRLAARVAAGSPEEPGGYARRIGFGGP